MSGGRHDETPCTDVTKCVTNNVKLPSRMITAFREEQALCGIGVLSSISYNHTLKLNADTRLLRTGASTLQAAPPL